MSFRDRFFTPQVARAITSPGAIVAVGAGVAVGIVLASPIAAVGLAAAAFAGRVAVAIPRGQRSERIDPFALSEPWRSLCQDAVQARQAYDDALKRARAGPLRDRLTETGERLHASVEDCWKVAQSGNALSAAYARIDPGAVERSVQTIRDDGRPMDETKQATIDALEAQLESARRMYSTIENTKSRLELLNARLDEAVTRTIELTSEGPSSVSETSIDNAVAGVTTEMEALRQALETTQQSSAF